MTNEEAAKMLTAKVECMERENSGTNLDCNHRNCDECDLCYTQGTMGEQIEALKAAIEVLKNGNGCGDIYLCTVSPEEVRGHKYDFYCGYADRRTD